jgi:hypothetical protein
VNLQWLLEEQLSIKTLLSSPVTREHGQVAVNSFASWAHLQSSANSKRTPPTNYCLAIAHVQLAIPDDRPRGIKAAIILNSNGLTTKKKQPTKSQDSLGNSL